MDFADYGDFSTFLQMQETFSRFSAINFTVAKRKGGQTAEMVRGEVIASWLAVFGAPGIFRDGRRFEINRKKSLRFSSIS